MNIETRVREFADILGESRIIQTLSKLAEIEANRCQKKIGYIRQELIQFEKRFNMTSDAAWTQFENGDLGDGADIMEWMGLYENLTDFQNYYSRLRSKVVSC